MSQASDSAATAEHRRLAEATGRAEDGLFDANPWYAWGPYLAERAWGTVREDYSADGNAWASFPHDHARSRAYRWNEDGMAGISDVRHELCLALALWNGVDPILKERMFGLSGPEGNHGEDVKECWWYLEGLPSHALLRWRYHYPQADVPVRGSRRRERPARSQPARVRAHRHRRVRRRPLLDRRGHVCQGLADRGPVPDRDREPRVRRGHAPRSAHPLVPQRVAVDRLHRHPRAAAGGRCRWPSTTRDSTGTAWRPPRVPTATRRRRCSATTRRTPGASTAARPSPRTRRTASTTTSSPAPRPSTPRRPERRRRGGTAARFPAAAGRS